MEEVRTSNTCFGILILPSSCQHGPSIARRSWHTAFYPDPLFGTGSMLLLRSLRCSRLAQIFNNASFVVSSVYHVIRNLQFTKRCSCHKISTLISNTRTHIALVFIYPESDSVRYHSLLRSRT